MNIARSGDINVSVGGGQDIGINVGGFDSFGSRAFTVGIGEGSTITTNGDYRKLRNLPSINGVTIVGALALEDLSLRAVYYDKTANFDALEDLISQEGALYIYSDYIDYVDDDGIRVVVPGIRIGDGHTLLKDLPFSGGSSGSANYDALRNKPSINGVTLEGDLELEDLSLKAVYCLTKAALDGQSTIIPPSGDIFIVSDYLRYTDEYGAITSFAPAVIIGDGSTELGNLHPMIGYDADRAKEEVKNYLGSLNMLVTDEDRAKLNRKRLKVQIDPNDEECLRFYYQQGG